MAKRVATISALILSVICCFMTAAYADSLKSAHYQVDESFLGNGGLLQSNSAHYQTDGSSIGDTGTGNSASSNFQTNSGYTTTGDPALSCGITSPNANFGSFSPSGAAVATSTFQVSDYTSYGYVVQIVGDPPSNGGHTLAAMTSTGPSQAGVEQFGINLVANTSPVSVGANPDHGQFGFGSAAANYDTPNSYRYVSGETIASAPKSSGITTYTISYLVNVTSLTPGGQYAANQSIICTGTY
jgi:hypothetical protein